MWIFPKVNVKETFVRVKKLLETCVEKIKDLFIGAMGDPNKRLEVRKRLEKSRAHFYL